MKAAVAALLALGACAAPPAARVAPAQPTIVSLNPCADAILTEVADRKQVRAVSHYSHDPRSTSMPLALARSFPATGGTVEEVLALDPDVVVASTFIAPATRLAFERLGVRVVTVGTVRTVAESMAQVDELARLAGHPDRGEALARRIETSVAAAAWAGPPVSAILWQPDGIVPGKDELVSDLMRRTGFANQSAARGMGQADYLSLERVLADPPALLLVAGNERGQRHPVLAKLTTVRRAAVDPSLLFCGGPTIERAARRLAAVRRGIA